MSSDLLSMLLSAIVPAPKAGEGTAASDGKAGGKAAAANFADILSRMTAGAMAQAQPQTAPVQNLTPQVATVEPAVSQLQAKAASPELVVLPAEAGTLKPATLVSQPPTKTAAHPAAPAAVTAKPAPVKASVTVTDILPEDAPQAEPVIAPEVAKPLLVQTPAADTAASTPRPESIRMLARLPDNKARATPPTEAVTVAPKAAEPDTAVSPIAVTHFVAAEVVAPGRAPQTEIAAAETGAAPPPVVQPKVLAAPELRVPVEPTSATQAPAPAKTVVRSRPAVAVEAPATEKAAIESAVTAAVVQATPAPQGLAVPVTVTASAAPASQSETQAKAMAAPAVAGRAPAGQPETPAAPARSTVSAFASQIAAQSPEPETAARLEASSEALPKAPPQPAQASIAAPAAPASGTVGEPVAQTVSKTIAAPQSAPVVQEADTAAVPQPAVQAVAVSNAGLANPAAAAQPAAATSVPQAAPPRKAAVSTSAFSLKPLDDNAPVKTPAASTPAPTPGIVKTAPAAVPLAKAADAAAEPVTLKTSASPEDKVVPAGKPEAAPVAQPEAPVVAQAPSVAAAPSVATVTPIVQTALVETPAQTPAAPPASTLAQVAVDNLATLGVAMAKKLKDGTTSFKIELHPADFGKVEVSLTIGRDGKVAAHLSFDSAATATAFHARESELRQQLAQSGLNVAGDALSFSSSDDRPAAKATPDANAQPASQQAAFDAPRDHNSQARANSRRAARALADSASAAEDTDLDTHLANLRRPVSRLALDLTV